MGVPGLAIILSLLAASTANAHHSYALFDTTRRASVAGTVAKVEWQNPHINVWVWVADKSQPNGYARYLFESGGLSLLVRMGWTRETLKVGERFTFDYLPLKDGRTGGALISATHADGSVTPGDPGMLRILNAIANSKPGQP